MEVSVSAFAPEESTRAIQIFANEVLSAITNITTKTVTGFLPMVGHKYSGQLMVVGRAVNGWTKGISPNQLCDDAACLAYAHRVHRSVTENMPGKCPMSWVTSHWGANEDYNTPRIPASQLTTHPTIRLGGDALAGAVDY
jgi:hypothetical protein